MFSLVDTLDWCEYRVLIGTCASQAGVDVLLTLTPRHFDPPPPGVRIVDPRSRE